MVGGLVGRVVVWLADSCVGTGLPGLVLQNNVWRLAAADPSLQNVRDRQGGWTVGL